VPSGGYLIPLMRSDGTLMVRYPAQNNPDRLNPNGPFMQHISHARRNVYTAVSQVDGIERINAYARIKTYPLYISYSIETRAALQEWRKEVLPASLMAVMISAALGALWMALIRQSHQRRLAAVKWRTVAHDLEAEIVRRENAEEALRQSQKMEAIGQLTGGIAHDFNNHLAGVSGNLELMRIRLEQDRDFDIRPYIEAAESGTDRAAKLTQRLLAFSRRQSLAPTSTDTNQLILSLADLIRGTVGPTIAVSTVLTEGLPPALCDPNQLENALLNLAINARDAMPDGGQLIISTSKTELDEATAASYDQLAGGWYVTIRISDTGEGMSEEVLRRACDPFFTTKPVGQGTGLGLSIVHGFVKQSRGHIRLFSTEGKGTTVEIFLPVDPDAAAGIRGSSESQPMPGANLRATVLVVDDKADLRKIIAEMLNVIGCRTLQAGTGAEAMEILASSGAIDLLVTDIGLPGGINGVQLAQNARATRQELKVLFITGYAADIIPHDLPLGDSSRLLNKPFAMETLAATVTAMLAPGAAH
jgi:signal transduction histidine kinase